MHPSRREQLQQACFLSLGRHVPSATARRKLALGPELARTRKPPESNPKRRDRIEIAEIRVCLLSRQRSPLGRYQSLQSTQPVDELTSGMMMGLRQLTSCVCTVRIAPRATLVERVAPSRD